MEEREKLMLGHEIADLVKRLADQDARRMRKALALSGGGQQLIELIAAVYRLPAEQRVAVLGRLEQMNQYRQLAQ
jgi:hypothetical protein